MVNQCPSRRKGHTPHHYLSPTGERMKVRGRKKSTLTHRKCSREECEVKGG